MSKDPLVSLVLIGSFIGQAVVGPVWRFMLTWPSPPISLDPIG